MKKRLIILLIQIIVGIILLVLFTSATSDSLMARVVLGSVSLILGLVLLKFKQPLARGMYKRQVETIKQRTSIEKLVEDFNHGGLLLSCVGVILIMAGLILR